MVQCGEMMMKFDMQSCGACRTCEIVCSYHHTGEFNPSLSSIKIHEKQSGEGYIVELLEQESAFGKACDGCEDEEEPRCMEACREKDVLEKMITQVSQTNKQMAREIA